MNPEIEVNGVRNTQKRRLRKPRIVGDNSDTNSESSEDFEENRMSIDKNKSANYMPEFLKEENKDIRP